MSIVRRTGANLLKMIASALDPALEASRNILYSKTIDGAVQLFSRASDGTIFQLTPTALGGGPRSTTTLFDDFIGTQFSSFAVTGGGSNAIGMVMGAGYPGTQTQQVSAAGVDSARITFGGNSFFFGGGLVTFETIHQIPTLSNGVNNIVLRDGFGDSTTVADHVDGFYLEYDLATHGNQNYRLCASLNSVRQKVDTGIAAVAGQPRRIRLTMNAAGTLGSCTIDGVPSANTVNANIPITSARATHIQLQAVKQLGAAAINVFRDYWWFQQNLTNSR